MSIQVNDNDKLRLAQEANTEALRRYRTDYIVSLREAIFTVLDGGDPEHGGDPWELDAVMKVSFDDATENRVRFVDCVVERLKEAK